MTKFNEDATTREQKQQNRRGTINSILTRKEGFQRMDPNTAPLLRGSSLPDGNKWLQERTLGSIYINFQLLTPVHTSLDNLDAPGSPRAPIFTIKEQ